MARKHLIGTVGIDAVRVQSIHIVEELAPRFLAEGLVHDGEYPVHITLSKDGRVASVTVTFLDEDG